MDRLFSRFSVTLCSLCQILWKHKYQLVAAQHPQALCVIASASWKRPMVIFARNRISGFHQLALARTSEIRTTKLIDVTQKQSCARLSWVRT